MAKNDDLFSLFQDHWINASTVAEMDKNRCKTPIISEEGERQSEYGWFLLQAMQIAKLSFDLSHIPSNMVRHYKAQT